MMSPLFVNASFRVLQQHSEHVDSAIASGPPNHIEFENFPRPLVSIRVRVVKFRVIIDEMLDYFELACLDFASRLDG